MPNSWNSKYELYSSKLAKVNIDSLMKESKSSSKLNDLHGRYKSMKDDEITSQKKLAHVMSEVKIPEANKISRNIGISENGSFNFFII